MKRISSTMIGSLLALAAWVSSPAQLKAGDLMADASASPTSGEAPLTVS